LDGKREAVMKVALLALTGFGNEVLKALIENRTIKDILVYTRGETGRFPYYDCEYLVDFCFRVGLTARVDLEIERLRKDLEALRPDMILVATFHKRIPAQIINLPKMGTVNIHPSLLPEYRGPTPTHWAIINGEAENGVTFHRMNQDYDMGDILFQQKVPIIGLSDGELREALAKLSGKILQEFIPMYLNGECEVRPQTKNEGSYYPKVTSNKGIALLRSGRFNRDNLIRGLSPYPGIRILE
jgi:methionyl-tRNA formyltransferase